MHGVGQTQSVKVAAGLGGITESALTDQAGVQAQWPRRLGELIVMVPLARATWALEEEQEQRP